MAYLHILMVSIVRANSTPHVMHHVNAVNLIASKVLFYGAQVAQYLLHFMKYLHTLEFRKYHIST